MKDRKVTAKELSAKLEIGKNQFKYWADKGNTPSGETVSKLADYFDVSVDYLIGKTDDPSPQQKKPALTESQIDLDEIDPVKADLIKSVMSMKREDVEKISQFFDLLKKS